MPIFMDRHEVPGATAVNVAIAHQKDLGIQTKYQCRTMTYWFDEAKAIAFCLIEAPDAQAVMQMHNEAHGLIPNRIIEVQSGLVEAFLGRIGDPLTAEIDGKLGFPVFEDSAFRTVLGVELKDVAILTVRCGVGVTGELLRAFDTIVNREIQQHKCGRVTKLGDLYLVAFASASSGVECARQIQAQLDARNDREEGRSELKLSVGMGLGAGDPVTDGTDLFGEAIQSARMMCRLARENRILAASSVDDEYRRERSLTLASDESMTVLGPSDERFLNELMIVMQNRWNTGGFHVDDLARRVGQSKSQLGRKMMALTGHSPKEFMRDYRLRKALELLVGKQGNVTEVAFETGFASAAHFSKSFLDHFGILPSAYLRRTN